VYAPFEVATISTFAGGVFVRDHIDGVGTAAAFHNPIGVALNFDGTIAIVVRL
jgi:hypothetical protein